MNREFTYCVELVEQEEGGFLVRFPDFPEAITQGDSVENTLLEAADCLEEAVANRMAEKLDIPLAVSVRRAYRVSLSATLAAKAALYLAMRAIRLSNVGLAERLGCDEKEVRRLLDPYYQSKIPRIESALHVLGQRLEIQVRRDQRYR